MFKKMKNRKGFTLIEMMAVIAIVAVLVAIIVPTVSKARTKAQAAADAANLRSLTATIATRYVTTTDDEELKAGLEVPESQLRESNLILVYKNGNELQSFYADALVGNSNYRGLPYNATVSELGTTDGVPYDNPDGDLLCVLGAGNYADMDLTQILMQDFASYIQNGFNNGTQSAIDAIKAAAGAAFDTNADALKKDAFANAYANSILGREENQREVDGGCDGTKTQYKDANGNWTDSYYDAYQSHVSAGNNLVDQGHDYTADSTDQAIIAGNNAANSAKDNYIQNEINKDYASSLWGDSTIINSGAAGAAGATEDGLKDVLDILADTEAGSEYEEYLKENYPDEYQAYLDWLENEK